MTLGKFYRTVSMLENAIESYYIGRKCFKKVLNSMNKIELIRFIFHIFGIVKIQFPSLYEKGKYLREIMFR